MSLGNNDDNRVDQDAPPLANSSTVGEEEEEEEQEETEEGTEEGTEEEAAPPRCGSEGCSKCAEAAERVLRNADSDNTSSAFKGVRRSDASDVRAARWQKRYEELVSRTKKLFDEWPSEHIGEYKEAFVEELLIDNPLHDRNRDLERENERLNRYLHSYSQKISEQGEKIIALESRASKAELDHESVKKRLTQMRLHIMKPYSEVASAPVTISSARINVESLKDEVLYFVDQQRADLQRAFAPHATTFGEIRTGNPFDIEQWMGSVVDVLFSPTSLPLSMFVRSYLFEPRTMLDQSPELFEAAMDKTLKELHAMTQQGPGSTLSSVLDDCFRKRQRRSSPAFFENVALAVCEAAADHLMFITTGRRPALSSKNDAPWRSRLFSRESVDLFERWCSRFLELEIKMRCCRPRYRFFCPPAGSAFDESVAELLPTQQAEVDAFRRSQQQRQPPPQLQQQPLMVVAYTLKPGVATLAAEKNGSETEEGRTQRQQRVVRKAVTMMASSPRHSAPAAGAGRQSIFAAFSSLWYGQSGPTTPSM